MISFVYEKFGLSYFRTKKHFWFAETRGSLIMLPSLAVDGYHPRSVILSPSVCTPLAARGLGTVVLIGGGFLILHQLASIPPFFPSFPSLPLFCFRLVYLYLSFPPSAFTSTCYFRLKFLARVHSSDSTLKSLHLRFLLYVIMLRDVFITVASRESEKSPYFQKIQWIVRNMRVHMVYVTHMLRYSLVQF